MNIYLKLLILLSGYLIALFIVAPTFLITMPFWFVHEVLKPIIKYYADRYDRLQELNK